MSSSEELRLIALREFAVAGYGATSLHRIAEIARLSKSSVLYHFSSKEALLEAAITPALDRMELMISAIEESTFTAERRREFIVAFVDFILEHRLEVHLFINQCDALSDILVVDRASGIVRRMAAFFASTVTSTQDRMRFAIALGGAAYSLVAPHSPELENAPVDEIRAALVTILGELLEPVSVRSLVGAPNSSKG